MVNIYNLKLTILQSDILRLLFIKSGMPLNQRSIAKKLGVSQPAVMKALLRFDNTLVKKSQDKESKRWNIELNRNNQYAMQLKRADNLKLMYESGLAEFLEESFPGATIILFGSYSRGDDNINSDIDMAIIGCKEKEIDLIKYQQILDRKITLNFYFALKDIHKDLRENICNGIVLVGGIKL